MAQGRCAGCGKSGSVCKIEAHTATCPDFIELYRTAPDKALTPAAELERYQREDRSPEGRAAAKEARLHETLVDQDKRRARQEDRWATPPDILA